MRINRRHISTYAIARVSRARSRHRPHTPRPTRFSGGDTKLAVVAEFYGTGAPAVSVEEATVGHVTATTTTTTTLLTCHWREEGGGVRVESLLLEPSRTEPSGSDRSLSQVLTVQYSFFICRQWVIEWKRKHTALVSQRRRVRLHFFPPSPPLR